MSLKSQKANMKAIHALLSQDLGYIYGESESRANGAKKQFLSKSAAFLRALGKDLYFKEFKVTTNQGGIAVSGEVTLMGLWGDGNGLYFQLNQPLRPFNSFLYREIRHMKDYTGGSNQWLPCEWFEDGDYERLVATVSALRKPLEQEEVLRRAA